MAIQTIPFTPELVRVLEAKLRQDIKVTTIAKEMGVSTRLVYKWLEKAGIAPAKIHAEIEASRPKKTPVMPLRRLTYEDYLKQQVKKGKMTPQERLKIVNKFRANFNNYVFVGEVEFNPESLDL